MTQQEGPEVSGGGPPPIETSRPTGRFMTTLQLLLAVFQSTLQEGVRSALAILLVVLLWITIRTAFQHVGKDDWTDTKQLLDVVIPAITGLLGAALGFYFGSRGWQG